MKTIHEKPLVAIQIMHLFDIGQITKELAIEALDKPQLAKMIIVNELMHDVHIKLHGKKTPPSRG